MEREDVQSLISAARTRHYPAIEALIREALGSVTGRGGLLSEMCAFHLATGGKRLRAVLAVLVAEALGSAGARAYPLAAACEVLHNATLVHDDAQDGDLERRGRPTVWARYGLGQAINVGDALYLAGLACLDRLEAPDGTRWALARHLVDGVGRVIDGQVRELELKDAPDPTLDAYVAMVEQKTSALFALPLVGAARLCGAGPEVLSALAEDATHLGVVFQIQDDLVDLWGDKGRDARGNDVREGKISVLVVHALGLADDDEAGRLRRVLREPRETTRAEDVAWAVELFARVGARDRALAEIGRREQAIARVPGLDDHPALARLITGLTAALTAPVALLRGPGGATPA